MVLRPSSKHVTAGGRESELLTLGPKFYDVRQKRGGGAIDLVMQLYRLDFKRGSRAA